MPMYNGIQYRGKIETSKAFNGKKKKAKRNRGEMKKVINDLIDDLKSSDLPNSRKSKLIGKLKRNRHELKRPQGDIAKDYNQALSNVGNAKKALKQAETQKQNPKAEDLKTAAPNKELTSEHLDLPVVQSRDIGTSDSEGGEKLEGLGMTVDEGMAMLQNEPGEFFNKLQNSDLSPKQQQMAFQQIQQQMQMIQQMMQMISSLSKSMHQTKMGVIRNM